MGNGEVGLGLSSVCDECRASETVHYEAIADRNGREVKLVTGYK